ncbi:4'-phosphopantetheinyl transferase family protein [Cupriavidus necator]|uniref:4'-phosphopantetheinyl transferase family protein n=1 Tax=Cupriavidus necator TaxID=106590 RepID=UPI002786D413|nr:4'-phosphopantetheinyl transferase superfamily protein [Cupriavidus necator]MDQ0143102.1 4'-phosphopantetheinyl transferase [Cupriavidus necator]
MAAWLRLGSVSALAAQAPDAQSWMSAGERARLAGMPATRRRAQFIAGRWLARMLLARAFGGSWQDWSLSDGEETPPRACGPVPASLSISHSNELVACGVGRDVLGLDLEPVRPRKGLDALYDAITTAAERAALAAHVAPADAVHRFAHAWTLKEAGIKRHGGALFATMLGHALTIAPSCAQHADACTWLHDGHVLALCAADVASLDLPDMAAAPRYWRLLPAGACAAES